MCGNCLGLLPSLFHWYSVLSSLLHRWLQGCGADLCEMPECQICDSCQLLLNTMIFIFLKSNNLELLNFSNFPSLLLVDLMPYKIDGLIVTNQLSYGIHLSDQKSRFSIRICAIFWAIFEELSFFKHVRQLIFCHFLLVDTHHGINALLGWRLSWRTVYSHEVLNYLLWELCEKLLC